VRRATDEAAGLNNISCAMDRRAAALVAFVRNARELRTHFFDSNLFGEPAWDILLDLYQAGLTQVRLKVSSVAVGADLPATTVLRWLNALEAKGLIEREQDARDQRRIFVTLSPKGTATMEALFGELKRELAAFQLST
jgi:DNA-binding MarR family transcriptional regulator